MDKIERLEEIVRQAMNIQIKEVTLQSIDSDGKPIEGTEQTVMLIFNLENISFEEVDELIHNGGYEIDSRILLADPEQVHNIFPHAKLNK